MGPRLSRIRLCGQRGLADDAVLRAVLHPLGPIGPPQLEPDLRTRTEHYLGQEQQHQLQHVAFNAIVHERYRKLGRYEGWLKRTCDWLCAPVARNSTWPSPPAPRRSPSSWPLADRRLGSLFLGADARASTLFLWHLAEEVEHKTAAFDVFEAIDGSRLRYAWASLVSVFTISWFINLTILSMLRTTIACSTRPSWFPLDQARAGARLRAPPHPGHLGASRPPPP